MSTEGLIQKLFAKRAPVELTPEFLVPDHSEEDFWAAADPAGLPKECIAQVQLETFFQADHQISFGHHRSDRHTHTYRLQVTCVGISADGTGEDEHVLVLFHALRERVNRVSNAYMQKFLNDLPPFAIRQPTTELFAVVLFQQISHLLQDLPIQLTEVLLWESPTQAASIRRPISI